MKKKNHIFYIFTLILVVFIVFGAVSTVQGQEKNKEVFDVTYQRDLEKTYVKEVRTYLDEAGYEYSGVMLTKVFDQEGIEEYTLKVHHKRFEFLENFEKIELQKELKELSLQYGESFPDLKVDF